MSEITLSLEHPSLGCGEIIARYDLSEIQEKAYQQGRADAIEEFMKEFEQKSEDIINAWCKDINLPKPTLARGLALARGIAEKVKGAEE